MDGAKGRDLKQERNRFVKLAFCRADMLFELDRDFFVVFAAGATEALFRSPPEDLAGSPFLNLIAKPARAEAQALLLDRGDGERIEDVPLPLAGPGDLAVPAVVGGYRAREEDDHLYLAIKIAKPQAAAAQFGAEAEEGAPLMDADAFGEAAAARLQAEADAGSDGQVSLLRIRRLPELVEDLEASDRTSLVSAIGDVLKSYSLGGDTVGRLDEESFAYAHARDTDTEKVNREVEETAGRYLPEDKSLETKSLTLDADGAGMSEEQVAKALLHTMSQFVSKQTKVTATRLSESLDELMTGTVETVKYIKHAAHKAAFELAYMPICDLRLGKVHHFEALSRFMGDDGKPKNTFQIITMAENLDLILDLDYAVVKKAIKDLQRFTGQGPMVPVAVNLSSISLGTSGLVASLKQLIDSVPDLRNLLMFELTESAEVDNLETINNVIQEFRSKGFQFSLDDFGAGSASFDYLNALEIDVVKFDGPVVRRACASKRGHDLLSTMAKMCANAGVETVGEMVEDKGIANQLYYCGIDYGQGWFFGKPDPDPFTYAADFAGRA